MKAWEKNYHLWFKRNSIVKVTLPTISTSASADGITSADASTSADGITSATTIIEDTLCVSSLVNPKR